MEFPQRSTEFVRGLGGSFFAIAVVAGLFLAGCGAAAPASTDRAVDHFRVLGLLYADYLASYNRIPPPDEAAFVKFLDAEPANWNKLAPTANNFLQSPRTGEPLRIAYGRLPPEPADGGLPWIACDSSPLDDQVMMVNLRGNVRLVSQQESAYYFPAK